MKKYPYKTYGLKSSRYYNINNFILDQNTNISL